VARQCGVTDEGLTGEKYYYCHGKGLRIPKKGGKSAFFQLSKKTLKKLKKGVDICFCFCYYNRAPNESAQTKPFRNHCLDNALGTVRTLKIKQ
jgi:hypothetical protein